MNNEKQIVRKMSLIFIGVTITALMLAFIWLNYIYNKFSLDNQAFMDEFQANLEETIHHKSKTVLEQGNAIYLEEVEDLKKLLEYQGNLLRNTLFDFYYDAEQTPESIQRKMEEIVQNAKDQLGIDISIYTEDESLVIGDRLPLMDREIEPKSLIQEGESLYYVDTILSRGARVYTYAVEHEYVANNLSQNFAKYLELDPQILIFDDHEKNLNPNAPITVLDDKALSESYLYEIKKSDLSGFYFGYYEEMEVINDRSEQRQAFFDDFLKNHIVEIVVYIFLLLLVFLFLIRYLNQGSQENHDELSGAVIRAYEKNKSIYDEPLLQGSPMIKGIDFIIRDSKNKQFELLDKIQEQKKEQKIKQVEILQLERKIQTLLDQTKREDAPLQKESFSLLGLIKEGHDTWDSESVMNVMGDDVTIKGHRESFLKLTEYLFTITRGVHQHYQMELSQEKDSVNLFINLVSFEEVDKTVLPKIRILLQEIGGSLIRNNISQEMVNLMLNLPKE